MTRDEIVDQPDLQLLIGQIRNIKYTIKDFFEKGTKEREFVLSSLKELENNVWKKAGVLNK